MANCDDNRKKTNNLEASKQWAYINDTKSMIDSLIGDPDKAHWGYNTHKKHSDEGREYHRKLYDRLNNYLMNNGEETGWDVSPSWKLQSLEDYMQYAFGLPGVSPEIVNLTPYRIKSLYTKIDKLLSVEENETTLPKIERGIMPAILFGYKHDKFGLISKLVTNTTQLTENSYANSSEYTDELINSNSAVRSFIETVVKDNIIDETLAMDGFNVMTRDNREVKFLYSYESEDDRIFHMVESLDVDVNNDERFERLDKKMISRESLLDGLSEKYAGEVTNNLEHGQMRKVRFVNTDDITEGDIEKIVFLLRKASIKKDVERGGLDGTKSPDIHSIIDTKSSIEYFYVMVKNDESSVVGEEEYRAYITGHRQAGDEDAELVYYFDIGLNKNGNYLGKGKVDKRLKGNGHLAEDIPALKDGYYYANQSDIFGQKVNKKLRIIRNSEEQAYKDFKLMNKPPSDLIMNGRVSNSNLKYKNIWDLLMIKRSVLRRMSHDVKSSIKQENTIQRKAIKTLNQSLNQRVVLTFNDNSQLKGEIIDDVNYLEWKSGKGDRLINIRNEETDAIHEVSTKNIKEIDPISKDVNAALENLMNFMGATNKFWSEMDEDGKWEFSSPNTFYRAMVSNYGPRMFEDDVVDDMIESAISGIDARLEGTVGLLEDDIVWLNEQKAFFIQLLKNKYPEVDFGNDEIELSNDRQLVIAQKAAMTKRRKSWVDPTKRRKDSSVEIDYINKTFRSLNTNLLTANLMDVISELSKIGKSEKSKDDFFASGVIDYLVNRVKMSVDDPTSKNPIQWMESKPTAKFLSKVLRRNFTEEEAYNFVKTVRAGISSALLGWQGASYNRTQTTNDYIHFGYNYLSKAVQLIDSKDRDTRERMEAIIHATGTDNVLTAFTDAMAPSNDITFDDYGMIPVPLIMMYPKQAARDFVRMISTSADDFIENGQTEMDNYLSVLEDQRLGKKIFKGKKKRFWSLLEREEGRLKNHKDRRDIKVLRKKFIDLLISKEGNEELLKAQFNDILGKVSDTRMKRMVAAKLSFMPNILSGLKGWATFTGGEKRMRAITVISELLIARDAGTISGNGEMVDVNGVEIEDYWVSPKAISIARKGVRNSMYGMSKEHMGDFFAGAGTGWFQYKEYPIQQMYHDYEVSSAFINGGHKSDRIISEFWKASKRTKNGIKYDPIDPDIDHEAIAMIRFISTRFAMSMVSTGIEITDTYRLLRGSPLLSVSSNIMRGGENPAIAMGVRALVWSIYGALSDDDEEREELALTVGTLAMRLLLPLYITLLPSLLYGGYKSVKRAIF